LPPAPTVVTTAASEVTQTSARLNATVNPNGSEVSECEVEYGTTTSYGSSAPCMPAPGSGESPVPVLAAGGSLNENATYHFRIVASNAGGTSMGSDETFTTTLVVPGPRWYKNGLPLPETDVGSGLPVLGWGAFTLEGSSGVGAITCKSLLGGNVANPVGGGAGDGAINAFALYDCVAPVCESLGGRMEVVPEQLPWHAILVEGASVVREKVENFAVKAICEPGEATFEFHGALQPELKPGTALSAPSKLKFDASAGTLEGAGGTATTTATLKFMGFAANEIVRAKAP